MRQVSGYPGAGSPSPWGGLSMSDRSSTAPTRPGARSAPARPCPWPARQDNALPRRRESSPGCSSPCSAACGKTRQAASRDADRRPEESAGAHLGGYSGAPWQDCVRLRAANAPAANTSATRFHWRYLAPRRAAISPARARQQPPANTQCSPASSEQTSSVGHRGDGAPETALDATRLARRFLLDEKQRGRPLWPPSHFCISHRVATCCPALPEQSSAPPCAQTPRRLEEPARCPSALCQSAAAHHSRALYLPGSGSRLCHPGRSPQIVPCCASSS